jgi:precorrin-6A/cobalt-precorrin-6A reductase
LTRPHSILILGGTTEGYELAQQLSGLRGCRVISSLAGRTASPRIPMGEVRIGGFGGVDGLIRYLDQNAITHVIDATHPFASQMGWHASQACAQSHVPLIRLERPAWQPQAGDQWTMVEDWTQAATILAPQPSRVFLTIGSQDLSAFAVLTDHWFLIRSVDLPQPMPVFAQSHLLLARGPFDLESEIRLLTEHQIQVVVSKNSGGMATDAKITAARQLNIGVIMLNRPHRPQAATFTSTQEIIKNLLAV